MAISMRIKGIDVYAIRIPLTEEFVTALGKAIYSSNIIVELMTDDGLRGYGAGIPSPRITGTTLETALSAFYRIADVILGRDPMAYRDIILSLDKILLGNAPTKAAIDLALYDLVSKYYGVPLRRFLGGKDVREFKTSVTISLSKDKHKMLKKANELVSSGVEILKIKIGSSVNYDINVVKEIRRTVGDEVEIRIDANQAYTPKQAIRVLRALENQDIEFCEQPVVWWDIEGLKFVKENTEIPIMADESIHSPLDVIRLIKVDAVDMLNIKIMKAGGLYKSIVIGEICSEYSIPCQIGCMSEVSLSIAAGVHLATVVEAIKYSDLDGHLNLVEDPFRGLIFKNSSNYLSNKPGIGLELDMNIIRKYLVAKLEFREKE